jgi:hypothetical protein
MMALYAGRNLSASGAVLKAAAAAAAAAALCYSLADETSLDITTDARACCVEKL